MKRPTGMAAFLLIQLGQTVSILGSSMTGFALSIWAYQLTGQATALALVAFFNFGPSVLLSPIAGALVDRWNRKLVMMISDLGAALGTIAIFILYSMGDLQIWHLYIVGAITGAAQAFQFPAYSAAITMMIPKEQYGRASGLMSLAEPAATIFAPVLAGALIGSIGVGGIMIIDIITFSAAFSALAAVRIPQPKATAEGIAARGSLLKESGFGFTYILARPSLLGLQLMFFYINLVGSISFTVMTPMILARTNLDSVALGWVFSIGSIGGLAGGLLMSAWGGPKRRVHGVLLGMAAIGVFAVIPLGLAGPVMLWAFGNFMFGLILPVLNGSNQALWQAKVPPDLQGRVFSVRRLIAQITAPVGMLAAGPLADRVFEPAMQSGGWLADTFGGIVGVGPGSGMGLMFVLAGAVGTIGALAGYLVPVIRNAEDILPDHNVQPELQGEDALEESAAAPA